MGRHGLLDQAGDAQELDAARQKGGHRHFVGGVEHRGHGAAGPGRGITQGQAREAAEVRALKGKIGDPA